METNKLWRTIAIVFICLTIVLLGILKCSDNKTTQITTKEVKGKFAPVKPVQTTITKIVNVPGKTNTSIVYKEDKQAQKQIDSLLSINEKMSNEFSTFSDSLKKVAYNKAIELKDFSQKLENDTITINASGLVRGSLERLDIDYLIKSQKIEIPKQKEVVFRLLVGGGFGLDENIKQSLYKANIGFQGVKGNLVGAEYLKVNNTAFYVLDYKFSLFSIRKALKEKPSLP